VKSRSRRAQEQPEPARPSFARREAGGLALLAAALAFNAVFLRSEARIGAVPLNDHVFHAIASERLGEALRAGEPFLDPWVSAWGFGFPVWRSYQPLPHLVAAAAVSPAAPANRTAVFALLATIVTGLLPLSVYAGARFFGLSPPAAGVAALICLLPSGAGDFGRYGLSYGASVWLGSGLYTQQFALLLLPIALGLTRVALDSGRWRFAAGSALALTALSHIVFGYVGALAAVVLAVVGAREGRPARIARLAWIAAGSFLLTAWFTIPLFLSRAEINHSRYELAYKWDSFGSRAVLSALFDGTLLDFGRLPALTLLVALGIAGGFFLRRDATGGRLLALTLVLLGLFLGRDTWGHLLLLFGVPGDLHLHRLQAAFELSACLLAAWFLDVAIRWLRRHASPLHVVAAVLLGAGVAVALSERAAYLGRSAEFGEASLAAVRREKPELDAAFEDVRRLTTARPGRVSAGPSAGWGKDFKVGEVPVYALLSLERFDQASFLFHALSRAGEFVIARSDENPAHDDVFGIRAVVAPADRAAPSHLRLVGRHGRFTVYESARDGTFGLGDVFATYTGAPSTYDEPSKTWLSSPLPASGFYVALGSGHAGRPVIGRWEPLPPAPPDLQGPRGEIVSVTSAPGRWKASVRLERACAVILKSTFFPDLAFTVDGVTVPAIRVTPGFPAAAVPAGEHVVEVVYRPSGLKSILFVAGCAAFALIAVLARPAKSARWDEAAARPVSRILDGIASRVPARTVALSALVLLSCRALLRGLLVDGHDATAYPPRLVEFFRAVADGHVPPVWAADLGNGFGQPLFGFAPPLIQLAALPFRLFGARLADATQIGLLLLVCAGAFAIHRLARELSASSFAALGAAAFWLFAPYFHTDLLVRAAYAEAAALAVSPVAVLALWRVVGSDASARGLALAAAAIAAVVLGHNAVALLMVPALALCALVAAAGPPRRLAAAFWGGAALAFGLALSAFFWLPALAENGLVKTHLLRDNPAQSWKVHFPTLGQLVYSKWGFGYSVPGPDDGMSLMVGPLLLLGGAVGVWAAIRRGPGPVRSFALVAAAVSFFGIFLASPLSAFVWDGVPLLQYLLYPWRALVLPTVFLPLLAAFALDALPKRVAVPAVVAVVLLGLPHTEPKGYLHFDEEFYEPARIAANGINTSTFEEYEPKWVERRPPHAAVALSALSGIEVLEKRETTARRSYSVRCAQGGMVEAATIWYPGWRVEVDGQPVATTIVPVRGTISFAVPSGSHRVSLAFERTPIRSASLVVSVLVAACLLAAALFLRRPSPRPRRG
jgi:uncharacterized membrane protein